MEDKKRRKRKVLQEKIKFSHYILCECLMNHITVNLHYLFSHIEHAHTTTKKIVLCTNREPVAMK